MVWIELDPLSDGLPFQFQETAYKQTECDPAPTVMTLSNWFSNDTGTATVSGGLVTGLAPGTTTVGGSGSVFFEDYRGRCTQHPITKSAQVTPYCAVPSNFREVAAQDLGNGVIGFSYAWDSNTGNKADLSACKVRESVTYPGGGSSFTYPSPPYVAGNSVPNPTLAPDPPNYIPATDGQGGDNHGHPGFLPQGQAVENTFDATQYYQYICPCKNNGAAVNLAGPYTITRTVSHSTGQWVYTITKNSFSSSVNIP